MLNSRKTLIYLAILLTVTFFMCNSWGCAKKEPFKIAIVTWVGYGPLYLAQEKGFYKDEGLDVEIITIEDMGARYGAITSGMVEVAINTIDAFAAGAADKDLPALAFLKVDDSYGGDGIVVKNEIKSIAELKGKTVAYPKGMPSHFFLLYLLHKAGLSSKDVISRTMEAGQAGAAFIAGKVDVAVTWEPWLTRAGRTEHGYILTNSQESPGLIVDILMINKDVAKKRPEDVRKLLRAWFRAVEYIKVNTDESYKIMAKSLGITYEEFKVMVAGVRYSDYEDNLQFFGIKSGATDKFSTVFNEAGKIWAKEGVIKNPVDAKEVLAVSFLVDLYK